MLKFLTVILLCVRTVVSQELVVTVQGSIRGESHDGYVSYSGIPYASVNGDAGRFKKAGLAPIWRNTRESSTPHCTPASEPAECLKLDVHVPSIGTAAAPWPVLAWVGGSTRYHVGKLVKQGVIVVVVYHRLGPTGFLCLNEEFIPGNAGAKDVVLALRWIRDNISAFRGNPASVTVAGQGFGAAIVDALTLTPMAERLFHGAILQSGTAVSPSAFNYDAEERARMLKNRINKKGDLVSALLNEGTVTLAAKTEILDLPYFPFGLCVEKEHKKEERLLSDAPYDLLKAKKVNSVPMMIGYNGNEGYIFASTLKAARVLRRLSGSAAFLLPEELKFINEREMAQVARQIKDAYFDHNVSMAAVMAYHSDAYFINHIHRSARLHASAFHHPVYYYQFSHVGNPGVEQEPGVKKTGAAHSDELAYLFSDKDYEGDDGRVQDRLVSLWTNFVKYLNPTPRNHPVTWEPLDATNPRVLDISTQLQMRPFPFSRTSRLWDESRGYSRIPAHFFRRFFPIGNLIEI